MTPRPLAAALAVALCAASASAGPTAGQSDPNKRCKLDGPKIDAAQTAACFLRIQKSQGSNSELNDDLLAKKPLSEAEEPDYCFCARMTGMEAWSQEYEKKAYKKNDISKDATADLLPYAKFYAQLTGHAQCGLPSAPPEARLKAWRGKFTGAIGQYLAKPTENPLIGKPSQTRVQATQILTGLAELGPKDCAVLADEKELAMADLSTWIGMGEAKDKKK